MRYTSTGILRRPSPRGLWKWRNIFGTSTTQRRNVNWVSSHETPAKRLTKLSPMFGRGSLAYRHSQAPISTGSLHGVNEEAVRQGSLLPESSHLLTTLVAEFHAVLQT